MAGMCFDLDVPKIPGEWCQECGYLGVCKYLPKPKEFSLEDFEKAVQKKLDYNEACRELCNRLSKTSGRSKVMGEDDVQVFQELFNIEENSEHMKKVIDWCNRYNLRYKKDVYENNSYRFKHACERAIEEYVSNDEVALGFYLCGHKVYIIFSKEYAGGITYKITQDSK